MGPRRDAERLLDIQQALEDIRSACASGRRAFLDSRLSQLAVVKALEIIGEASNHLSEDLRASHPTIPWGWLIGLRNTMTHEYFRVNAEEVWRIASDELPGIGARVRKIRARKA